MNTDSEPIRVGPSWVTCGKSNLATSEPIDPLGDYPPEASEEDECPKCKKPWGNCPCDKQPTTAKWTEQTVKKLLDVIASPHLQRQNVADAHNAAMKEAYQKGYDDGNQARSSG